MDAVSAPCIVRELGRQPYEPVWRAMQRFTDARTDATVDELWLVEHDPVFTLGQAGKDEHVLAPGDIPVVHVDRGGQVTYHGPGQIVAYPLFDLKRLKVGVRDYVCKIEQAMIDTLAEWNIHAERQCGAGRCQHALLRLDHHEVRHLHRWIQPVLRSPAEEFRDGGGQPDDDHLYVAVVLAGR